MDKIINYIKNNYVILSLFFIICIFFIAAVQTSGDTYWFMSIGRDVWQNKSIPTQAIHTYGVTDKSFNSVEWISGLIYFFFVSIFGINGLLIVRVLLTISTLYFTYKTFKLFTNNPLALSTLTAFIAYILSARTDDRPETFSYLFLSILNFVCFNYLYKHDFSRLFYVLPLIFLVWPQTHPFAILGVVLFSFFSGVVFLEKVINKTTPKNLLNFLIIYGLSIFAALVQYKKTFIFLEVTDLAGKYTEFGTLKDRIMFTEGVDFLNQIPIEIYAYFLFSITFFSILIIYLKKTYQISHLLSQDKFFISSFLFYRLNSTDLSQFL